MSHGFIVNSLTFSPFPNLSFFQTSPLSLDVQYRWPSKTSRLYGLLTSRLSKTEKLTAKASKHCYSNYYCRNNGIILLAFFCASALVDINGFWKLKYLDYSEELCKELKARLNTCQSFLHKQSLLKMEVKEIIGYSF